MLPFVFSFLLVSVLRLFQHAHTLMYANQSYLPTDHSLRLLLAPAHYTFRGAAGRM